MKFSSFFPGIIWFILSSILLAIPGDNLPHSNLFNIPYFDKIIHFVMFSLLTALFCLPLTKWKAEKSLINGWYWRIMLLSILYGIAMEFVQKYWVFGRSFDLFDIVMDSIGSLVGTVGSRQILDKKIGPDGNQGRNQN